MNKKIKDKNTQVIDRLLGEQNKSNNIKTPLPLSVPKYLIDAIDRHQEVAQQPSRNNTARILLEEILAQKGYL